MIIHQKNNTGTALFILIISEHCCVFFFPLAPYEKLQAVVWHRVLKCCYLSALNSEAEDFDCKWDRHKQQILVLTNAKDLSMNISIQKQRQRGKKCQQSGPL